jgi:lytic cellulose monooxygenase (C1-hydroxylating)
MCIDKWANQIAADNGDNYKVQLPSDIKPGTYILRTELIAMHGNMTELKQQSLKGQIQIYPHCFNLDIVGSGSATPEGVVFPGAYKPNDPSFMFQPFMTYGNDTRGSTEHNSKFVSYSIVSLMSLG